MNSLASTESQFGEREPTRSNAVLQARGCVATKIGLVDMMSDGNVVAWEQSVFQGARPSLDQLTVFRIMICWVRFADITQRRFEEIEEAFQICVEEG